MSVKLVNIGFGNIISAGRIISITSPDSAPAKRIIQEAREKDSMLVVLSALQPETVAGRINAESEE